MKLQPLWRFLRQPGTRRAERALWQGATSVERLGELGAQWLDGTIRTQIGVVGPYTTPSPSTWTLLPLLAALNRAGFYTTSAQPGSDHVRDGVRWSTKAAVEGFLAPSFDLPQLYAAIVSSGLDMRITNAREATNGLTSDGIVVTERDGQPWTRFGRSLTDANIRQLWDGFPRAVTALSQCMQVTVAEAQFGPSNRLWELLTPMTARVAR